MDDDDHDAISLSASGGRLGGGEEAIARILVLLSVAILGVSASDASGPGGNMEVAAAETVAPPSPPQLHSKVSSWLRYDFTGYIMGRHSVFIVCYDTNCDLCAKKFDLPQPGNSRLCV